MITYLLLGIPTPLFVIWLSKNASRELIEKDKKHDKANLITIYAFWGTLFTIASWFLWPLVVLFVLIAILTKIALNKG